MSGVDLTPIDPDDRLAYESFGYLPPMETKPVPGQQTSLTETYSMEFIRSQGLVILR